MKLLLALRERRPGSAPRPRPLLRVRDKGHEECGGGERRSHVIPSWQSTGRGGASLATIPAVMKRVSSKNLTDEAQAVGADVVPHGVISTEETDAAPRTLRWLRRSPRSLVSRSRRCSWRRATSKEACRRWRPSPRPSTKSE